MNGNSYKSKHYKLDRHLIGFAQGSVGQVYWKSTLGPSRVGQYIRPGCQPIDKPEMKIDHDHVIIEKEPKLFAV